MLLRVVTLRLIFSVITGIGVIALAVIPLRVDPAHIDLWKGWVWFFAISAMACIIAIAIIQMVEDREREKRETERDLREQDRASLLSKLAIKAGVVESSNSMPDVSAQTALSTEDPQLYLDLPYPKPGAGLRAPLVLENRGKITAHNVTILPFKLKRKSVTFPEISELGPGVSKEILPQVDGAGHMLTHDLFHWLVQDWDGNGELTNDWPIDLIITYTDPLGKKKIQESVTLLFHPITFIMDRNQQRRGSHAPWITRKVSVEFTGYRFTPLPQ